MKKFIFVFLAVVGLLLTTFQPVFAQASDPVWYDQPYDYWQNKVYDDSNPDEIFGERYTAAQVQWIVYTLVTLPFPKKMMRCALTQDATICGDAAQELASASENLNTNYANNTNRSFWEFLIDDKRQLSGIAYVRNTAKKFSVVPEAYAQAPTEGFGFTSLSFIQELWKSFRDLAYLFFVVVTVVFAFMIMFRVKISPQAVITVQSAIPKLVIGLIFVTFSYAIAGLMIDLMYVVMGILAQILSTTIIGTIPIANFDTIWGLFTGQGANIIVFFLVHFVAFISAVVFSLLGIVGSQVISAIFIGGFLGVIFLIALIVAIILVVIYIWTFIKIIWMLIKVTANILLAIIFSPLQITFGLLGSQGGIGSYIKTLISNLMVFPVIGALLLFSLMFALYALNISIETLLGSSGFTPILQLFANFINARLGTSIDLASFGNNYWSPPFLSDNVMGLVFVGISLSILMIVPKAVELIQGFMSGKGFDYGTAIGGELKGYAGFAMGRVEGYQSRRTADKEVDVATAKAEKDSEGLKKAEIEAVRARQWSDRISRFRKGMGV